MKKVIAFIFSLFLLGIFLYWQNNDVGITEITIKNHKIPKEFNEYKILQISDLHNKKFNDSIFEKINQLKPNLIVITGDLVDSRRTNIEDAMSFVNEVKSIAPIYYVNGNHEARVSSYDELQKRLTDAGVQELSNQKVILKQNNAVVDLIGLNDLNFFKQSQKNSPKEQMRETLNELTSQSKNFQLLLAHRPELFDLYTESSADLVFSGHAHGGQIRLPILGGLLAPNQGFLPKYSEGIHEKNGTSMVISRGLGNSLFPFRIFNPPELVVVTLEYEPQ